MKNIKLSALVIVAIGLTVVSLGSLGVWGYKTYFKANDDDYNGKLIVLKPIDDSTQSQNVTAENVSKKSSSPKKTAQTDNFQHILTPVTNVPAQPKTPDAETAREISRLKAEIELLSKNKNSDADIKVARQKIEELQQKIDNLVDKNSNVETENKRLFAVLRQLSDERKDAEQKAKAWPVVYENKNTEIRPNANPVATKKNPAGNANTVTAEKNNTVNAGNAGSISENIFAIEGLQLSAVTVTDNKEIETQQAYQTDKLVGNITIKNKNFQNNAGEIIVVVLQPDGRVLQKSTWESGTFQSPEGRKVYTCRMRFDYTKGETKHLSFFLNSSNYQKGNYTMQVYCKGVLIGKIIKTLS